MSTTHEVNLDLIEGLNDQIAGGLEPYNPGDSSHAALGKRAQSQPGYASTGQQQVAPARHAPPAKGLDVLVTERFEQQTKPQGSQPQAGNANANDFQWDPQPTPQLTTPAKMVGRPQVLHSPQIPSRESTFQEYDSVRNPFASPSSVDAARYFHAPGDSDDSGSRVAGLEKSVLSVVRENIRLRGRVEMLSTRMEEFEKKQLRDLKGAIEHTNVRIDELENAHDEATRGAHANSVLKGELQMLDRAQEDMNSPKASPSHSHGQQINRFGTFAGHGGFAPGGSAGRMNARMTRQGSVRIAALSMLNIGDAEGSHGVGSSSPRRVSTPGRRVSTPGHGSPQSRPSTNSIDTDLKTFQDASSLCQEYKFSASIWDAILLVDFERIGFLGILVTFILFFLQACLMAVFVGVIISNSSLENHPYSPDVVAGFERWRYSIAHDFNQADPFTSVSHADRVCAEDSSLSTSALQLTVVTALREYIPWGGGTGTWTVFSGPGMAAGALCVWFMVTMRELQSTFRQFQVVMELYDPGQSTRIDETIVGLQLVTISLRHAVVMCAVLFFRFIYALLLLYAGTLFICREAVVSDLLLHVLLLEFVLRMHECIYEALMPGYIASFIRIIEPVTITRFRKETDLLLTLAGLVIIPAWMLGAWYLVLEPFKTDLQTCVDILCGGRKDFVIATDAAGVIYGNPTPGFTHQSDVPSYTKDAVADFRKVGNGGSLWDATALRSMANTSYPAHGNFDTFLPELLGRKNYGSASLAAAGYDKWPEVRTFLQHSIDGSVNRNSNLSCNVASWHLCRKQEAKMAVELLCPSRCGCDSPLEKFFYFEDATTAFAFNYGCAVSTMTQTNTWTRVVETMPCVDFDDTNMMSVINNPIKMATIHAHNRALCIETMGGGPCNQQWHRGHAYFRKHYEAIDPRIATNQDFAKAYKILASLDVKNALSLIGVTQGLDVSSVSVCGLVPMLNVSLSALHPLLADICLYTTLPTLCPETCACKTVLRNDPRCPQSCTALQIAVVAVVAPAPPPPPPPPPPSTTLTTT